MANIQELRAVGASVIEGVWAVRDGLDVSDIGAIQALVTGLIAAADDIREDPDSAVLEIVAGIAIALAEKRRG